MKNILAFLLLMCFSPKMMSQQARSVVLIYLDGGPSQTDTFDPKPEATRDYYGSLKEAIQTNVPGIVIGEKLPLLAQMADKYSLIRSMTHGANGHETGHYAMITGDLSRSSTVYPSYGSVISYKKRADYKGALPLYVSLTSANSRFNEGGFLGNGYKSYDTGGEPEKKEFEVEGIFNHYVKPAKFEQRMEMLGDFEKMNPFSQSFRLTTMIDSFRRINTEFISGTSRQVFDLTTESKVMRERYGMHRLGQSCLAARKLVEAGVPCTLR